MNLPEIRRLLVALGVALEDGHAITVDLLRPPRERELGQVLHERNYREARQSAVDLLASLMQLIEPPPDGGHLPN